MRVNHREDDLENHDRGLDFDLPRLLQRRGMLRLVAGVSLVTLVGCSATDLTPAQSATPGQPGGPGSSRGGGPPPNDSGGSGREVSEGEIPEETAGPYPGDGSNGANILDDAGVVRSDITSSFGSSTTKAEGIPLKITMTILEHDKDDAALVDAAVYLWHCDRSGQYSLYSQSVVNENYLRGMQETDKSGSVTFTSILPACYSGRWPHIHFEVYPSLAKATSSENKIATSQMAIPEAVTTQAYATAGYEQSVSNLSQVTLASDNVFGDGYDLQIPTVTGDPTSGYELTFSCAV
jgi:protocatechuate 3,4-dioxygenase beta subunit